MNTLSTLAAKNYSLPNASALPFAAVPQNKLQNQLQNKPLMSAPPPAGDLVSLSKTGVDLSKQKDLMSDRVDGLGSAAVDMAQNFLTKFAQSVLGDAANGMTVSFDSASVSASSSFQGGVEHSEGPNGVSDASAFRLEDNASFKGKGVITTADGRRFNFDVEVQYKAIAENVTTSQSSRAPKLPPLQTNAQQSSPTAPPSAPKQHDENKDDIYVDFPGTVKDLFNMMGHQNKMSMSFDLPPQGDGKAMQGQLMLRLIDMIENPSKMNFKLAKAYGVPEVSTVPTPPTTTAEAAPASTTNVSSDAFQA